MSRIRLYNIGQLDAYVFGQAANAISAAIEIYGVRLSDRVKKLREVDRRLQPLADALIDLLRQP